MSNEGIFDSDIWTRAKVEFVRSSRKVYWMPGATHCSYLVIGGGGGGGSGRYSSTANGGGGSGGSGAQLNYCRRFPRFLLSSAQIWEYFDVTIGAGGTGGAAVDVDNAVTNAGTTGGNSSVVLNLNIREGASQGVNTGAFTAVGGGLGAGGSSSNVNATATANGYGALNGATGGQGSASGFGSQTTNHSGNSFGTNPFHGSMVGAGAGGNGKANTSQSWNVAWTKFYQSGSSTPTLANGTGGRDAYERAANIWNYVEAGHFKEAPFLEDIWWFTGLPGGTAGTGGGTTVRGGRGGDGYLGTGGAGGSGSGAVGSGKGGDGGSGIVVFWWEKL
jgi:hypothetical protein